MIATPGVPGGTENGTAPDVPGPTGQTFEGPWFEQQLVLSLVIGCVCTLIFGVWKRHYPSLYLGRHRAHKSGLPYQLIRNSTLGWIWPTVMYSDRKVLHTVGIDAAVALLFFKMGFVYLSLASVWAVLVLIPVNYYYNGTVDGVSSGEALESLRTSWHVSGVAVALGKHKHTHPPLGPRVLSRDALYENTQLASTYFYTILAFYVIWRTYNVFIQYRQGYASWQVRSQTARTVEVRHIPDHLSNEPALTTYFGALHLEVESVHILQDTKVLDRLLLCRIQVLRRLERTWSRYVGDPCQARSYDPRIIAQETNAIRAPPVPGAAPIVGAAVKAPRARPTLRRRWWGDRVDAIDQLSYEFAEADRAVREQRQRALVHGHTAFVTFAHASNAQVASQVVHYPLPGKCRTEPAVEPRDIIWVNEEPGVWDRRIRQAIMTVLMAMLLTLTLSLGAFLATLVNMNTIRHYAPWLADLMDRNLRLRAFVQKSLPTLLLIAINALIPLAMQTSTYYQRIRSRSRIDHSVLNKYYLYLLFSVVLVFAFTNVWDTLRELAESPMRMIDKLAQSLPAARNFSLSYVIFQGLAMQPFQLLQLPSILSRQFWRVFVVNTPRDRAHAIQAPMMSVGTLYPQALLVFTLAVLYSIVSPLILVFGAVYFGVAYVVLKYQLLNVWDKPYDSHGHAWPLAVTRCVWALLLFHVFQLSLFSVRKQLFTSLAVLPLIALTSWWSVRLRRTFAPLTSHLNLYDIYLADDFDDQGGDSEEEDGSLPFEPALSWSHPGLLGDSNSQYGQPALTCRLPGLWLPAAHTAP